MKQGFTLAELLVVVLIIGVLAAVALPQYSVAVEKSRSAEALSTMDSIRNSVERYYYSHNDTWPEELAQLDVNFVRGKDYAFSVARIDVGGTNSFLNIVAERRLQADGGKYFLKTIMEDTGSTIISKRCCTDSESSGDFDTACPVISNPHAQVFCNSITNGGSQTDARNF